MPPSSPSDDTPAWIKGDLPPDFPEAGAEPAPAAQDVKKIGSQAGGPAEDEAGSAAAVPAAAGEMDETDQPAGAPAGDRLEAEIAARLAELDGVLNDADELPGTPGAAEIDDDLDDELEAAEDDGRPPMVGELDGVDAPLAEMREADIAERLAELDSILNDADELPGAPAVAEIDEDLEDELDAAEDEDDADDLDEMREADFAERLAEMGSALNDADELPGTPDVAEFDEDLEEALGADDDEDELVEAPIAVEDEAEAEQGNEADVDEDDEDEDDEEDENEAEGFEPDEVESEAGDLEALEVDDVIIVELVGTETQGAEPEPADEMGLPEAAFLAELAQGDDEADESLKAAEEAIEPEAAASILEAEPAAEASGEAEPGMAPALDEAAPASGEGEHAPGDSNEQPAAPASVVEALPPIEPPVVEDLGLEALIESLLFVADGAVLVGRLAEALEVPVREVEAALSGLAESYQKRGLSVQRFREKVQLTTSPSAAGKVERFLGLAAATPLSRAALEALAIVAYQQPVTRPQIEAVRGVNSDSVIKNLLTKGLIEESGRAEGPGRPVLYSTTPEFMQHFGLTSLAELPPLSLPNADSIRNPAHILKG